MGLTIQIDRIGGVPLMRLEGELDIYTVPCFTRTAEEALPDGLAVIVDLRLVDLVDSSGLSALIRLQHSQAATRPVALVSPHGSISRMLELANVADRFFVADDADGAFAALARAS